MKQGRETTSFDREVVHTLAQVGTTNTASTREKGFVIVSGNGSDAGDIKTTRNRAKRKLVSQVMALELLKIAEARKNQELVKRFRNTYYCLDRVRVANSRIYGKFCKNRVCTVCLAIRKAELINKYSGTLNQWPNPYFLTLTVKSVPVNRLRAHILSMKKSLQKIIRTYNKRHLRGKGPKLAGVYSIESNFNPSARTYNPHFHIITKDRTTGEILKSEWIKRSKNKRVLPKPQKLEEVYNKPKALIELIKYGTKIFTEQDVDKRIREKSKRSIYIKALYSIVEAFHGIRVFEHFGFDVEKPEKEIIPAQILTEFETYQYSLSDNDWMNENGTKPLTGYLPTDELIEILEKRINTELN